MKCQRFRKCSATLQLLSRLLHHISSLTNAWIFWLYKSHLHTWVPPSVSAWMYTIKKHTFDLSPQGEWDGGCEELTASWCMKLSLWCLLSLTCWQNSDLCLVAWHHYHSSSKMDSLAWHWRYYWNPISDISQRKCALPRDVSMPALIYDCAIPPIAHKARLHVECIIVKQEVTLALATWQCIIFSTLCPIPTERNVEFPALWSACGCNTLSSLISKTHIIKGQTLFILTPWMLKYKRILF